MAIEWVSIGIQTGLIAAVLAGSLLMLRFRMVKWVSLGFARMMKQMHKAAESEPEPASSSSGALNLGGFKITPELVQTGMTLLKSLREMGILKGGGSGGGGGW